MQPQGKRYWFPTRSYGWGWGLPVVWQGWVVFLSYAALIALVFWRVPPGEEPLKHAICVTVLTIALVVVCWLKGAPPRWRWGGK
jgi:hypothetical protein